MKNKQIEESYKETLKNNLYKLRHAVGLSQYFIAEFLNINRSTYSYYESGKTRPSFQTMLKLSKLYDVSIEMLLTVPLTSSDTERIKDGDKIVKKIERENEKKMK